MYNSGPLKTAQREAGRLKYEANRLVIIEVARFLDDPSDENMYALQERNTDLILAERRYGAAYKAYKESDEFPYKVPAPTPFPVPTHTMADAYDVGPVDTMSVDALTADTPLKKFVRFFKEGKKDE